MELIPHRISGASFNVFAVNMPAGSFVLPQVEVGFSFQGNQSSRVRVAYSICDPTMPYSKVIEVVIHNDGT